MKAHTETRCNEKAAHTPGPWNVAPNGSIVTSDMTHTVAPCIENAANARLIAAAPDLLYILVRILGAHDTKNNGAFMGEAVLCHHYAETARAAIAKVRGES